MKRSNRLVLLVGVFLAIVAFVGILLLMQDGGSDTPEVATELPTVVARADIPLGTVITADQVTIQVIPITGRDTDAFGSTTQVIGKIVRQQVTAGAAITATTLTGGGGGTIGDIACPPTLRCMAVQVDQVTVQVIPITGRDPDAFGSTSQVIGKIAREQVTAGAAITATTLSGGAEGQVLNIACPPTLRCMSVQVDQVTGVGTVIKTGDYVDMVVGFQSDKFPVITINPADDTFTVVSGLNSTSVKALIQGLQVLGTLLPPTTQTTAGDGTTDGSGTALTGQQQIVILAADAQQAEIIKFAQLDGSMSLVLRSPTDFIDPETGDPYPNGPVPDATTGVILKTLVDTYGVLPPELVETILPAQGN